MCYNGLVLWPLFLSAMLLPSFWMFVEVGLWVCQVYDCTIIKLSTFNRSGMNGNCNCTLPPVEDPVRAIGLGNGTGVSNLGVIGGQQMASIMVTSLPTPYIERWMAMGVCTVLSVLVLFLSSLLIVCYNYTSVATSVPPTTYHLAFASPGPAQMLHFQCSVSSLYISHW